VTVDFGHIEWMATFRGRAASPSSGLFYVTGGAAVAEFRRLDNHPRQRPGHQHSGRRNIRGNQWRSTTRWGWTVGGGIDMAFNQNLERGRRISPHRLRQTGAQLDIPSGLAAAPFSSQGHRARG